jgi:hypothetical protein
LAALALMQMGSWQGAGKVLASNPPSSRIPEEEVVVRGVRWSFLFKRAYERLAGKPKAHRASGARKSTEGV